MTDAIGIRVTFTATKYPETLAFFSSLGYAVEASWDEPASSGTIFTLGGATLEVLAPSADEAPLLPPCFALCIETDEVDDLCQRLRRQGVAITNDPTDQPWGERRLSITDPNGIIINYYSTITVGHEP